MVNPNKNRNFLLRNIMNAVRSDESVSNVIKNSILFLIDENELHAKNIITLKKRIEDIEKVLKDKGLIEGI